MTIKFNRIDVQKRAIKAFLKRPRLLDYALKCRNLLMRGPLQKTLVRYYQKKSKTKCVAVAEPSLFADLNVERTIAELEEKGFSIAFQLSAAQVEKLFEYKNLIGSNSIHNLHKNCASFERIARDSKIIEIARQYLGAEPILYAASLYYTGPLYDAAGNLKKNGKNANSVHFDANDFRDLNLFIYLTDVDADASPHILFEGTHKRKTFRDLITRWFAREEIESRFGSRLKVLTGPAGFAFFEDTSIFHIQSVGKRGRLTATACYTLQRSAELSRYH